MAEAELARMNAVTKVMIITKASHFVALLTCIYLLFISPFGPGERRAFRFPQPQPG
jgi:hypothetical protein